MSLWHKRAGVRNIMISDLMFSTLCLLCLQAVFDFMDRKEKTYTGDWAWTRWTTKERWFSSNDQFCADLRQLVAAVVKDKETARKVTPDYDIGVKRPVLSDDYLQTFNKDNFRLVTDNIQRLSEKGVVTSEGEEIEVDVIVYATGFDCFKSILPFQVWLYRNIEIVTTTIDDCR